MSFNRRYSPSLLARHQNNALIDFLTDISWSLMNFEPRFPNKSSNILVVGPAINAFVGFSIIHGEACMGVQDPMFEKMRHIHWRLASLVRGQPGLYLVHSMRTKQPPNVGFLRFPVRTSLVNAMSLTPRLKVCRMSEKGDDMSWRKHGSFYLPLKKMARTDWA